MYIYFYKNIALCLFLGNSIIICYLLFLNVDKCTVGSTCLHIFSLFKSPALCGQKWSAHWYSHFHTLAEMVGISWVERVRSTNTILCQMLHYTKFSQHQIVQWACDFIYNYSSFALQKNLTPQICKFFFSGPIPLTFLEKRNMKQTFDKAIIFHIYKANFY